MGSVLCFDDANAAVVIEMEMSVMRRENAIQRSLELHHAGSSLAGSFDRYVSCKNDYILVILGVAERQCAYPWRDLLIPLTIVTRSIIDFLLLEKNEKTERNDENRATNFFRKLPLSTEMP